MGSALARRLKRFALPRKLSVRKISPSLLNRVTLIVSSGVNKLNDTAAGDEDPKDKIQYGGDYQREDRCSAEGGENQKQQ